MTNIKIRAKAKIGMINMKYVSKYNSPIGEIMIASNEECLTELWFINQKYSSLYFDENSVEQETEVIKNTKRWLDIYFSGKEPNFNLPLYFCGTDFQKEVWQILCSIPYGKSMTYGDIAKILARKKGIEKMSAQAVGGAVRT